MKWGRFTLFFVGGSFLLGWFFLIRVWGVEITTTTTVTPTANLTQNSYRWYGNANSLTPTTGIASENVGTSTPNIGGVLRLRMNVNAGATASSGLTFSLQFSNSTSSGFANVGTSTAWVFYDNPGVADGAIIMSPILSDSDVGESYGESNPSAASPNEILSGQKGEWDWVLQNNSAATSSNWYFRMIFSSGTVFDSYGRYPTLSAVAATTTPTSTPTSTTQAPSGGGTLLFPRPPSLPTLPLQPEQPLIPSPCDNLALQKVDLNGDCMVDLIDLSILLYYYGGRGGGIQQYDFNNNGQVDFPDVSVMMFYWTG